MTLALLSGCGTLKVDSQVDPPRDSGPDSNDASQSDSASGDADASQHDSASGDADALVSDAGDGAKDDGSPGDADGAVLPTIPGLWSNNPPATTALYFADVTGDTKADLIAATSGTVVVWPSNGKRFVPTAGTWLDAGLPVGSVAFGDVTGDGKADLIETLAGAVTVFPSLGTSFGPGSAWAPGKAEGTLATVGCSNTQFADVDGDGKADLVAINATGEMVSLSTGSSFADAGAWTADRYYGQHDTSFAPVRGTPRSDAVAVSNDGVHVLPSNGLFFDWGGDAGFGATGGTNNYFPTWTTKEFAGAIGTYFVDVSGDGKADAIAVDALGVNVLLSNGTSFPLPPGASIPPQWASANFSDIATFAFADADGDGCADFISVYPGGVFVALSDRATAFVVH